MTSARQADEIMTVDAFRAWCDEQGGDARFELLDGLPYSMSSERAIHARVKAHIFQKLAQEIEKNGLPCEAFMDGMAVRIDDANVFEPDALVRCGARLADETVIIEDPVIVVEVASPSTQRVDALTKFTRYFRNPHIMHYLIAVPSKRMVVYHHRTVDARIESTGHEDGTIILDPPGLELSISALFPIP